MVQTLILTKLDFFAPGRFTLIAPGNPRHALLGQKISSGPFDSVSIEWYKFYCLTPPGILPLTLTLTLTLGPSDVQNSPGPLALSSSILVSWVSRLSFRREQQPFDRSVIVFLYLSSMKQDRV